MWFVVVIPIILVSIVSCGWTNEEIYQNLGEKLGKPIDVEEYERYMKATFVQGLKYAEVHRMIDEIGDSRFMDEVNYPDGKKVEIIQIRTGVPLLSEYNYAQWMFKYDAENKLVAITIFDF
jgi:hypothetical protein